MLNWVVLSEIKNSPARMSKLMSASEKGRAALYQMAERQIVGACATVKAKLTATEKDELRYEIVKYVQKKKGEGK